MTSEINKKIGYATGCFDLLHKSHVLFLTSCKSMCDILIIGLTTDERMKVEKRAPFLNYEHRSLHLQHLNMTKNNTLVKIVDSIIPNTGNTKIKDYELLKFDILFTY